MNVLHKKICILGDFAVGKTSLAERFVYGRFNTACSSSIGVHIYRKTYKSMPDQQTQIMIWDLAGEDKLDPILTSYLQGSSAALIVGDLSRGNTIRSLEKHILRFQEIVPHTPMVIAGNKCDLDYDEENMLALTKLGQENHSPVMITSAKTGQSVENCFHALVQEMAI